MIRAASTLALALAVLPVLAVMRAGPEAVASFLAELARRRPPDEVVAAKIDEARAMAVKLRAIFDDHPKQGAFCTSKHKRRVTLKTRRAGATVGGCRELLARAIETPGFRSTIAHSTLVEARARAWRNDTQTGIVDVIEQFGTYVPGPGVDTWDLGGVLVEVREADHALNFSNNSQIELFGADNVNDHRKKRGNAKHVFWVDEAQDFKELWAFYKAVVLGSITDFDGEVWISGTPGRDCSGMFYEISNEEEPLAGWEIHAFAVVDNPFFGHVVTKDGQIVVVDNLKIEHGPYADLETAQQAAVEIRWENTAGKHIRENNLKPDDPDLLREWFAKWVKGDSSHVYPVHVVPEHALIFAPQRLRPNPINPEHPPWYDHERAVEDLPRSRRRRPYHWLYAIGADFGYMPDPFAVVVWAFTPDLPDIYEMFSWKQTRVLPDDQRDYCKALWDAIDAVAVFVGDPGGQAGANLQGWRERTGLPIDDADKTSKDTWREFMAGDIRKYRVHYRGHVERTGDVIIRHESPLLDEHRHLVYLPVKPGKKREEHKHRKLADGRIPGNDCSDAGLYSFRHLCHYLHRAPEDKPKPGSPEAMAAEERELEQRIDDIEQQRKQAKDDGDDGWEQIGDGGYGWG